MKNIVDHDTFRVCGVSVVQVPVRMTLGLPALTFRGHESSLGSAAPVITSPHETKRLFGWLTLQG